MKKNNRKGFTIVELVIVIAVIAILAAVLIPTFSNITTKAKTSANMQEARNIYTEYLAVVNAQPAGEVYVQGGDQYFKFVEGQIDDDNEPSKTAPATGVLVSMDENDKVWIDCKVVVPAGAANHEACTNCNGQHNLAPADD